MDIEKLKRKILDLAIKGKLVPQDPNEEPAPVLIEKIKEKREQLINEGKIKRIKDESYIYKGSDNCYYENNKKIDFIPPIAVNGSFIWIKGKNILFPMESIKPSNEFDYIDIDAIDNKLNIINNPKHHTIETAPSRATRKVYSSSTLFSMVRPYLKNIAHVGKKYKNCIASTGFYVCTPMPYINENYLFFLLTSDFVVNSLNYNMKGDNSPSINGSDIEDFYFPIPSLDYQEKVVNKIKLLIPKIEKIRSDLIDLNEIICKMKYKILDEVFGENSRYKSYNKKLVMLSELFTSAGISNKEIKMCDICSTGRYPVISQSKNAIDGFTNDDSKVLKEKNVILFGDHTRVVKYIDIPFAPGADGTKILIPSIFPKYFYYCVLYAANRIENRGYGRHFALLKRQQVLIVDYSYQEVISSFLDNYFQILNSIIT